MRGKVRAAVSGIATTDQHGNRSKSVAFDLRGRQSAKTLLAWARGTGRGVGERAALWTTCSIRLRRSVGNISTESKQRGGSCSGPGLNLPSPSGNAPCSCNRPAGNLLWDCVTCCSTTKRSIASTSRWDPRPSPFRIRISIQPWSDGAASSTARPSTCTRPTVNGSCAMIHSFSSGKERPTSCGMG